MEIINKIEGEEEKNKNEDKSKDKGRNKNKDEKKAEKENQEQYRVVINKEASKVLEKMLSQVTTGFEASSISKSDLANWVILNSQESFGEAEVRVLRQLHFDERKILASLLRDARDQNNIPENLKKAIREHFGLSDSGKRKSVKDNHHA